FARTSGADFSVSTDFPWNLVNLGSRGITPKKPQRFATACAGVGSNITLATVEVGTNGKVGVAVNKAISWISLDGITYEME
ncbi:MAG: hypothetical protein ACTMIK_13190, partial [Galactobacter sp.]